MTVNEMIKKLEGIPEDAIVLSDSGWEADASSVDEVFFNEDDNEIVLTQFSHSSEYDGPSYRKL